jgi:hypothetical protein
MVKSKTLYNGSFTPHQNVCPICTVHLVGKTKHHVNNTKELAKELTEVSLEEDDIFNLHYIVSLFTKTPIEESLVIIKSRLELDHTLKDRTRLSIDDIMDLLKFVLTTTYFIVDSVFYRQ